MTSRSKLWYIGEGTGKYTSKGVKESTLVANMKKAVLKKYPDAVVLKFHGSMYTASGVPDLIIAVEGATVYVEAKRPGGDTTALQYSVLASLKAVRCPCGVAESVEEVLGMIKDAIVFRGEVRK